MCVFGPHSADSALPPTPLLGASPLSSPASRNTKTVTANMEKLEEDRQYLQDVLSQMKEEVGEQGTFSSLTRALQQHHSEKDRMRQIIQRSAGGVLMELLV